MIFAFLDDRGLMVHDSLEEVVRQHEPIDVENGDVRFFDAEGRLLEAIFSQSNRHTKVLGSIEWIQQGLFSLRASSEPDTSEFRTRVLQEAAYLHPNRWFASLEALREKFSDR